MSRSKSTVIVSLTASSRAPPGRSGRLLCCRRRKPLPVTPTDAVVAVASVLASRQSQFPHPPTHIALVAAGEAIKAYLRYYIPLSIKLEAISQAVLVNHGA
ncbi:MAG TPA: hypothetical protein VK364_09575 [Hymenobacter sp.]|nr:hypothetical protein [Hymenobacter sp.]